jgi:integrase
MAPWTIHGLRHAVGTHLREDLGVRADVVSMILGHRLGGPAATRLYDRAQLLPERRAALVAWAAWLERVVRSEGGAEVVPIVRA